MGEVVEIFYRAGRGQKVSQRIGGEQTLAHVGSAKGDGQGKEQPMGLGIA